VSSRKQKRSFLGGMLPTRVQVCNQAPADSRGDYVLYLMIANRRVSWNFSLDRAVAWAQELNKPLVVLEALRCDYPWASERLHRFVLDGMAENARRLVGTPALYYSYVEPSVGAGRGLLEALARRACVVVTDDFPCFFLPRMVASAAQRLPVRMEKIDSNGLLPMCLADRVFKTAHSFRRFVQLELPQQLAGPPQARPLSGARLPRMDSLPRGIERRWPPAPRALLAGDPAALAELPIDHTVSPVATRGGAAEAEGVLKRFLQERLRRYLEDRLRLDDEATSGLSPYLHFGHISAHQVFHELMEQEDWSPDKLGARASGSRSGWWGVSAEAEAFLDQLITWRELGFNFCAQRVDYDSYESLPEWARQTLGWRGSGAQLPADAVGEEDPGVDAHATPGAKGHDRAEQQVCAGWARSQLLQRHLLVPGTL
jgi:deoxyribodipyrimidine photo-lyase